MKEKLRIDYGPATLVDAPVVRLREVWDNALQDRLAPVHA
jgi:hypothetical protein